MPDTALDALSKLDAPSELENGALTSADSLKLDGRRFISAQKLPMAQWPCSNIDRKQSTLTLKDNDLFLITNTLGSITGCIDDEGDKSSGLFCRDTRFLSRLDLQINAQPPILLSSSARKGYALSALCANPRLVGDPENPKGPGARVIPAETIGIQRDLVLQGGLFEELVLTNYGTHTVSFEVSLSFDADFADLFEIRGQVREKTGTLLRLCPDSLEGDVATLNQGKLNVESDRAAAQSGELSLAYLGVDGLIMESRIRFEPKKPDCVRGYTALWWITLEPHQSEAIGYAIEPHIDGKSASYVKMPAKFAQAAEAEAAESEAWRDKVAYARSDNPSLNQIIMQAEQDTYLLRQTFGEAKVLSAGVPWFSTMFGRDSLIAALQTLMLDPDVARQTLVVLAHYQGNETDEWREEAPGKILHELRLGEMARCGEIPHTPYFGTIDATPLWLMLYADYYAWTGDQTLLDQLWDNAIAAMGWIDRSCEQTGYLAYHQTSTMGFRLGNQGWKDSGDSIVDGQGRLTDESIALSEVQGYVYEAKIKLAKLARLKEQPALAKQWEADAEALKARFQKDFWMAEKKFIALALAGEQGRQLDSITSNPGHCLSTGILSREQCKHVAARLREDDMFSGWGIRTLSSQSPAYNPMGYHVGSIWPHDNGMIAAGLRAQGFTQQAFHVAQSILDMTHQQPYQRPPELFCGFDRTPEGAPVRYPVACSPQAWATGTVFQILQVMMNLVPDATKNQLRVVHPHLPESVGHLSVSNLKIGDTTLSLAFERTGGSTACRVVEKRGDLRVVIEA